MVVVTDITEKEKSKGRNWLKMRQREIGFEAAKVSCAFIALKAGPFFYLARERTVTLSKAI